MLLCTAKPRSRLILAYTGTKLKIECRSTPLTTWKKDGVEIVHPTTNGSYLVLKDVSELDNGVYTCSESTPEAQLLVGGIIRK